MSRQISVITAENVAVNYVVAGIASRFMALLVDLLIQIGLLALFVWLFNILGGAGLGLGSLFTAMGVIVFYLTIYAYALIFEAMWQGRTPGKRLFGLRVIRDGGYPLDWTGSSVRNLLRIVDFGLFLFPGFMLMLCGAPGLLSIFLSPQYKRIGDYAAGTLVIVESGNSPFSNRSAAPPTPAVLAMLPFVRNLTRLTPAEYRVVRRFSARRADLDLTVQASLGERIARPLMEKLEIEAPILLQLQYADLLEAMERVYAEERGVL